MTFNKPSSLSSLARTGSILSAMVIATFLFAGSLTTIQQTAATTTTTDAERRILDTQVAATENLSESDRDVNGIEFTPRWGAVSIIQPNDEMILFANCLEDEFAVSSMPMFQSPEIIAYYSFPIAFPDNSMSWLTVVKNTDTDNARAASIGVICADENDGGGDDIDIDISSKTTIQNTVNNFVQIQNNQIINLANVVNVYQEITQNAYNIVQITGNNNIVNQVVQQSANQILNANTTNPTDVQQIIDQNAVNVGVITEGGSLSQDINQNATNTADVTGGDGGGGTTTTDQTTNQDATNTADVTGGDGGGGTIVDQAIAQGAGQTADVTGGDGGTTTTDQTTNQNANQTALVNEEEEEEEDEE